LVNFYLYSLRVKTYSVRASVYNFTFQVDLKPREKGTAFLSVSSLVALCLTRFFPRKWPTNLKMDDGKLVELVQAYPHLYNKRHELYKNNRAKENAWKVIAQDMHTSGRYFFNS
jgi:hypothetical protein